MIKAIFANDLNGGMGCNNKLPWPHDREDMLWFKNATQGHVVVMGSNTWTDPTMPKPLPNRHCVVVTNKDIKLFEQAHDVIMGNELFPSLEVLSLHHPKKDIWIIGGAKLLNSTQHLIQQVYHTLFHDTYECDVHIDYKNMLANFSMQYETYGRNKIFSVWHRT